MIQQGHSLDRVRFKCKKCGTNFSFSVPLPNHEKKGKRLSTYKKALIRADHILNMSYTEIQMKYEITRSTVNSILNGNDGGSLLYVWRSFAYQRIRSYRLPRQRFQRVKLQALMGEELEKGYLRQGYGFPGMDLRNGKEAFVENWRRYNLQLANRRLEELLSALEMILSVGEEEFSEILSEYEGDIDPESVERLYRALDTLRSAGRKLKLVGISMGRALERTFDQLKVMLVIRPGDYVLIPGFPHHGAFTLVEVVSGYDFQPIEVEGYEDFGHFVRVRKLGEFYVKFEDLETLSEGYRREVQILYEFLVGGRRTTLRPFIDIVEPKMKEIYGHVNKLVKSLEEDNR